MDKYYNNHCNLCYNMCLEKGPERLFVYSGIDRQCILCRNQLISLIRTIFESHIIGLGHFNTLLYIYQNSEIFCWILSLSVFDGFYILPLLDKDTEVKSEINLSL